jgi:hypothetical protein
MGKEIAPVTDDEDTEWESAKRKRDSRNETG